MDPSNLDATATIDSPFRIWHWEEMQALGQDNFPGCYAGEQRKPEDLWSIIYTSGSTGMPKGAMMTDLRWNKFVTNGYLMPTPIRILSFAPLGHVSERQLTWIVAYYGGIIGFYNGNMALLFDDMKEFNPTYVSAPPRIYNAVYTDYKEAVDAAVLKRGESERWKVELEMLEPFRGVFGNAIQFLVTGSAPTSEAVKRFMRLCWAVPVYDGYGTTEAGGIATDNVIGPDVDVKLIDVPELGYLTTDKPPRGEICVKTKHMITGYFKNPDKTAESFVDGYFRTGDIGVRVNPVRVEIIDRIKNVFKLSQGEFVAPARIEAALEKSALLDQICVSAEPGHEFVVAVVVPCLETCARLFPAPGAGTGGGLAQLVADHRSELQRALLVRATFPPLIACLSLTLSLPCRPQHSASPPTTMLSSASDLQLDFRHIAKRERLMGYEIPARVILCSENWTAENDLLTPSMKLKRAPIAQRFREDIAAAAAAKVDAVVGQVNMHSRPWLLIGKCQQIYDIMAQCPTAWRERFHSAVLN
jgi:long-subunit acyl-CoA synthetase (AMP-forming)